VDHIEVEREFLTNNILPAAKTFLVLSGS